MLDLNAALVAIAVSAALGVGASAAEAAPKEDAPMDFSHVTSRAKAKALVKKGELVEIYLFAIRLGGPEAAENTGFVPPGALGAIESAEDRIIGMIKRKAVNG